MSPEERLNRVLSDRGLTIALAESCTGGLISSRITDVAGSSVFFDAAIVTYSNRAKEALLSVPHELLLSKGAVSAEVAEGMAEGVRRLTGVALGLSVTGIAGPGGGTVDKPVGTVYMAVAAEKKTLVRKHHFRGDRLAVKQQTADEALLFLLNCIEEIVE